MALTLVLVTVVLGDEQSIERRTADRLTAAGLLFLPGALTVYLCFQTCIAYESSGWRASDLEDAAGAVYASHLREPFTADGAEGARAVACVHLRNDGS